MKHLLAILAFAAGLLSLHAFEAGPGGLPAGWNASAKPVAAGVENGVLRLSLKPMPEPEPTSLEIDDGIAIIKRAAPGLVLTRRFPVEPETVYLLQLSVKTENSAVLRCGNRRMAYNTPGEAQLLCDLVKSGKGKELEIAIDLGGLPGAADFELSAFELRKPQLTGKPIPRPARGTTVLAADTVIVHPAGGEAAAAKVREAIRAKTGLTLRVLPDRAVTEEKTPAIREEFRKSHLILLGRLGSNRAIWAAYGRFQTAVDGYYPGPGGYAVQTAADVFGNGANHLILGGSDDAGVVKAADVFAAAVGALKPERGKFVLPFLFQVELGGDCKKSFDADEALWARNPAKAGPAKLEPGYGRVVRFYTNVMNYCWSGRDLYRQRSREYLAEILKDQAYTHHYIIEFFVRACHMARHTDLFTDEERGRLDALVKQNFLDFTVGPDLNWMTLFNRPYELTVVMNRHNIAPWMADVAMADYLRRDVPLSPDEDKIVRYRAEEKHTFFRYWTANTFNVSLPRVLYGASEEEVVASLFRYALEHEQYALFTSGNALKALRLWEMTPIRPRLFDDRLVAGILACYYHDGRFAALYRQMPTIKEHFQNRYVNDVHRYAPGPEVADGDPAELAGVTRAAIQRQDHVLWNGLTFKRHRTPDFPASEGAEVVSFRQGFGPEDDFLLLRGLGNDVGSITDLYSHGKTLMIRSSSSTFGVGKPNYYDYNAVNIQRLDRWDLDPKPYAGAAKLLSLDNQHDRGSATIEIAPFVGCRWRRSVVWLRRGLFLVRDRITAEEDGEYLIQIGWRPQGAPSFDGRRWTGVNAKTNFHLTSLGEKFTVIENLEAYRRQIAPFPKYHHTARVRLAVGESVDAATLLEVKTAGEAPTEFAVGRDGLVKIGDAVLRFDDETGAPPETVNDAFEPVETAVAAGGAAERPAAYEVADRLDAVQGPGRLPFAARGKVLDFGRPVLLSEIRCTGRPRLWTPLTLPADLEYSLDGKTFQPVASEKLWYPGVKTANYGQADPVVESHQYSRPEVRARYLRGTGANQLSCYSAETPGRGSDLAIQELADGGFLVGPDVYPRYIRERRAEDFRFARLDGQFKVRYRYHAPGVVQESKMLAWPPNAAPQLCVVTEDAKIRFIDDAGKVAKTIDLYELQAGFNRRYGKPNTRHPAGGFTLPFSIGVRQPKAGAEPQLVVGRYVYYSFLKPDGALSGVLAGSEYSLNSMLDRSADLDGDGDAELYALGRYNLAKIYGPENPRTLAGFPQIHQFKNYRLPGETSGVEGDRMLIFKALDDRHLAVARASFLAVFDARAEAWRFSWAAPVSLTAAAQIAPHEFLAASEDGLLRHLTLKPDFSTLAEFGSLAADGEVKSIRHSQGRTLVATTSGVFEYRDGELSLLLAGFHRDAALNADGKLLVLAENGELVICNHKK